MKESERESWRKEDIVYGLHQKEQTVTVYDRLERCMH